jgi:hypothetical protein
MYVDGKKVGHVMLHEGKTERAMIMNHDQVCSILRFCAGMRHSPLPFPYHRKWLLDPLLMAAAPNGFSTVSPPHMQPS